MNVHPGSETAPVAGVAVFALVPWIAASSGAGFSPLLFLLVLACPVGMWFMMRGMHSGEPRPKEPSETSGSGEDQDQRLAELQRELSNLQQQQEALARDIAQAETGQRASGNGAGGGRTAPPAATGRSEPEA